MEHGGDPERGAEPPGIAPERQQGLGCGSEQEREEASAVVQHQSPERGRQGGSTGSGEGAPFARRSSGRRAGPGTWGSGVCGRTCRRAGCGRRCAHVEMPTEQGGAAGRDGAQDGALVEGERVLAAIGGPVGADDIGDVEGGTGRRRATRAARRGWHRGLRRGRGSLPEAVEAIEGTLHAAEHRARDEGVARGAAERAVAEEGLDARRCRPRAGGSRSSGARCAGLGSLEEVGARGPGLVPVTRAAP